MASQDPADNKAHFWILTTNLAADVLFASAFPVLTAMYAVRGLKEETLQTANPFEAKLAKFLNVDAETLNEYYAPLVTLGFPFLASTTNGVGILGTLWANWCGLTSTPSDLQLLARLQSCERVSKGYSWLVATLSFATLGIWTYRRQQRRSKQTKNEKFIVGAPEISLGVLALIFYPLVSTPIYLN